MKMSNEKHRNPSIGNIHGKSPGPRSANASFCYLAPLQGIGGIAATLITPRTPADPRIGSPSFWLPHPGREGDAASPPSVV